MTVHDYAHLHEHRARLDRVAAAHRQPGADAHRSVRTALSAVRRTLAGHRADRAGATSTGRLAHVRGR